MILKAAKRINDINALTERKDAGNTAAASSARPPLPPAPASKKRKSDSPLDLSDKRQKPSPSLAQSQPSTSSTTTRPVTSNKTHSTSASSSSSSTLKTSSAAPMIRSDSASSTSEPVKKATMKQGTLSFGQKPPSDRKPSPLASTTSAQAAKPPSHSKGDDKVLVTGSSSVSATLQQKKPTSQAEPPIKEKTKASETITLSDSD